MSRYIDADALKAECYKFANDVSRSAMAFVQGQINAAPTADVVEVVRCGKCKYWGKHDGCIPFQHLHKCYRQYGMAMSKDDYCSLGERGEPLYD